jgi:hypothetical protein
MHKFNIALNYTARVQLIHNLKSQILLYSFFFFFLKNFKQIMKRSKINNYVIGGPCVCGSYFSIARQ